MAIAWDPTDVRMFLAGSFSENQSGRWTTFQYQGALLKYEITIDSENDVVFIGADDESPFGADSMMEAAIACDAIRLVQDEYYPAQQALEFRYGAVADAESLRLMLLKRPNGDLKIWPAYPMPLLHPLRGKQM